MFAPLVLLTILFGFYPAPLLDVTAVSVKKLVSRDYAGLAGSKAGARSARMQPLRQGRDAHGRMTLT